MTANTLHERLAAAVDDTTTPPGFSQSVLRAGRGRRRRRTTVAGVVVTVAVVGGALLLQPSDQVGREASVASSGSQADPVTFEWAASLPEGSAPALPYFADGSLWSGEQRTTLPSTVDRTVGPWAVSTGWIVMTGERERDLAWALLSPDGTLRSLPATTYEDGLGLARVEVSADGRQVALGQHVVDVETMEVMRVPHAPENASRDGFMTDVRAVGFTEQGLVYEAAPYRDGLGTTWLLADDGETTRIDPPRGTHIRDGSPGDIAVRFDYNADESDTCITSYRLVAAAWSEEGSGCMGRGLGEAHSISPDGRWLLTDDPSRVWDLPTGEFVDVDVPGDVVEAGGEGLVAGARWESDDTFLVPVSDRSVREGSTTVDFDQQVQVVRCTVSTGSCERAGDVVDNRVVAGLMATTEFRFAIS